MVRDAQKTECFSAMNLDLEERLRECGVAYSCIPKSEKVKMLARWTATFPELVASAHRGQESRMVESGAAADRAYGELQEQEFFIFPDDPSGMPSCLCEAHVMPDLSELVSDTVTRCDELVILASDFTWSAVLLNHGSPQLVGRHFQYRSETERRDN